MIATTHPVSPEEIMALADGELSTAEAVSVTAHLADCAECAALDHQFHSVSQSLATWSIPAAPSSLDASVAELIAEAGNSKARSQSFLPAFSGGPRWSVVRLGAVTAVLLLLAAGLTITHNTLSLKRASQAPSAAEALGSSENSNATSYATNLPAPPPPAPASTAVAEMQNDQLDARASGAIAGNYAQARSRASHAAFGAGGPSVEARTAPPARPVAPSQAPMIAHSVSLTVQVRDLSAARTALEALLARHHGYAAQLTANTAENSPRRLQSSLRVPDAELAAAIAEMRALGHVETETQSGDEVTQQHADLVARLENSRETEQRLRAILEQRTGKIEDVLQVEEEIARVRGEIEQMEADQKVLEHRVDFATIELQLAEQYREQLGPQSASVPMQIRNAFVAGLRHGASTLLGILLFLEEAGPTLLIWLAILGIPGFLLWRRYRRIKAKF